ncbi:lymphocyte function-associated antigen 3 isoform X2 [Eublepharis macularius]|uniref:Lymphocyte function-associated antigen 3 isoform X2 n=1 Tax=Eublepharis macularius TaxID=481883 RepID=A0AA97KNB8_EUBMA|nr:lymphocyte function-associated antigen 3 isoform X2 [Eublepharis macularius]
MPGAGGRLVAALCALSVCLGCQPKPPFQIIGVDGKEATLEPKVNGSLTEISWKRGRDKVAEWDQKLWFTPSLEGRVKLDPTSGRLTFVKLQLNDTGEYRAEVLVGEEYQCTFFSLRVLDRPKPPQLNCTATDGHIQVRCALDTRDAAQNITPSYKWKYQKSSKEIPENTSAILLEKDVDRSDIITCTIGIYSAKANGSISLKDCAPEGDAPQKRDRTMLLIPFVLIPAGMVGIHCLWKCGVCLALFQSTDVTEGAEAIPENQRLQEERSRHLEEGSGERC